MIRLLRKELTFIMEKSFLEKRKADIQYNLDVINEKIAESAIKSGRNPADIQLMAVTKTVDPIFINYALDYGVNMIGENRVQEMLRKKPDLHLQNVQKHLIGHLQTNKIKYIAPFVTLIHAIDSLSLLEAVNKEAAKNNRVIDCLLQFHIAQEETKFGLNIDEAEALLQSQDYKKLNNINICGVMGMATFTDDTAQIRNEFKTLKNIFELLKGKYFSDNDSFKEISMGMSDDYPIAIEEGATMVRVGSKIFGARNYNI